MSDRAPFLNGYRAPLLVNGATLIPILWVLINVYSDVHQLKAEALERGPVERLAKLEAVVQANTDQRYRSGDAARDFALRDEQIQQLREDLRALQDQVARRHP